jgi:TolB protein
MGRNRVLTMVVTVLSWAACAQAQQEVELGIRATAALRIPLWLAPVEVEDETLRPWAQKIEEVLLADLQFAGIFEVHRGLPPARESVSDDRLEAVVRGRCFREGEEAKFEGRVFEAISGSPLGGRRYRLEKRWLRRIAHHFADQVVYALTGEKGVASSRLLYVRNRGERWELVLADYDGYEPQVLVSMDKPILNPRWVEKGRAFVYTSYLYGKADLFYRKLDETRSRAIAAYPGLNYSVDWSDRRGELVATLSRDGNPEIYLLDLSGKILRRLTHHRAIDCSPSWSPTGREILFVSDRSGSPQIYVMDASGANLRRLTYLGDYCGSPAWSPRGDRIAFVARIDGTFQLCTMRPDGSDAVVHTSGRWDWDTPRWAPDGRHLVATREGPKGSTITVVDIATGGQKIIARGEYADWSRP